MKIELLYFAGCPNHGPAMEILRETLRSMDCQDKIDEVEIRSQAEAEAKGFVGSPTIRINDSDIEPWARSAKHFGLSCRTYFDSSQQSGVPSRALLRSAITEGIRESS